MSTRKWTSIFAFAAALVCNATAGYSATIFVGAGGDLQAALNAAQPGDTILLAESEEFVGNFVLPVKSGSRWITVRSAVPDSYLPADGWRIHPSDAAHLPRLRSPNSGAALRTAPGAHHWDLRYLEFRATFEGFGDLIQIGDGSSAQNSLDMVPHDIVLSHLYVHGDPLYGQKRCISLNAAQVIIRDSYIAECKGVGLDTQAIAGWNGPGPYLIENNYLEGAGENVMFGGADPAIANLVVDGVTVRRNYITRPMSWRQPIIGTVQGVIAAEEPGGSLPSGVYAYRVVARGYVGQNVTARSTASTEAAATVQSAGGAVRISWQPVARASEYRVYGRTTGAQSIYWTVTGTEFIDVGQSGTIENVPMSNGNVWTVKNLFELKNARNVVVESNVLENHWRDAQPGYAIVLTPRNSQGKCTWCTVENARFEYNIIRNVAAGINLLGYDSAPSGQAKNIVVRHNLFHKMSTALGGNGWFMLNGNGPRDITLEHNTIDSNGSTVVSVYGGTSTDPMEVYGWRMIANATRHGRYGINGSFFSYGLPVMTAFYPDYVFVANYLAGGNASKYPPGNFFTAPFEAQFVDAAAGDFTIRQDSFLKSAAPDGGDVGADMSELRRRVAGVEAGEPSDTLIADFMSSCDGLACVFTATSAGTTGGTLSYSWDFGDTTTGTASPATHVFADAGTYEVRLIVTDQYGNTASVAKATTVSRSNVAPIASFTTSCRDMVCTFTNTSQDPDGQVTAVTWQFGDGVSVDSIDATHQFAATGTYSVTMTVTDNDGAASTATVAVDVRTLLHAAFLSANIKSWTLNSVYYWSTDITVAVHGVDHGPIAGATVTAAWTGAVMKAASCVTTATGLCTFKSGTLSRLRYWTTLTITGVAAPLADYDANGNHDQIGSGPGTAVTINQPTQ
jgi:PKD repeat protein